MTLRVTPDGARYLAMARGDRLPFPFHLRWLAPYICGQHVARWRAAQVISLLMIPVLAGLWVVQHQDIGRAVAAGALLAALPVMSFNARWPVLVDAPAMALALGATCLVGPCWPAAIVLALLAGATKETAPVFAALWAWNPLLLVGLVAPAARAVIRHGSMDPQGEHELLAHPLRTGLSAHAGRWREPRTMLTPWGAALAALVAPTIPVGACLTVAYGQLLTATDTVRLYQWAAPLMVAAAVHAMPPAYLAPLVVLTIFNPWRGNGL